MKIDTVIEISITALYKDNVFNEKLYLKGGQALRLKENLTTRFSADMDFSIPKKVEEEEDFFKIIKKSLYSEFLSRDYYLFDFTSVRKPKIKKEGTPDFWGGWEVNFKIIDKEKMGKSIDSQRREAIIPEGAQSPKIKLDISEHEYCGSVEKIKINSVEVNVYSRALLVLEKIRAICQQHPSYELTGCDSRARDFYDIERLWNKVVIETNEDNFIRNCEKHLEPVFSAKGAKLELLDKMFEADFLEIQKSGWPGVRATVSEKVEDFDYYVEVLRGIGARLKKHGVAEGQRAE